MIARLYNRSKPSNVDVLSNILSYLTTDDYVSFGLVNDTYLYVIESQRRHKVREHRRLIREFNDAEEIGEVIDGCIRYKRCVGSNIISTIYTFNDYVPTSLPTDEFPEVNTIKTIMNDKLHGLCMTEFKGFVLIDNYKNNKPNGECFCYKDRTIVTYRKYIDGNLMIHIDYMNGIKYQEHTFDKNGNRLSVIEYNTVTNKIKRKDFYYSNLRETMIYYPNGSPSVFYRYDNDTLSKKTRWRKRITS